MGKTGAPVGNRSIIKYGFHMITIVMKKVAVPLELPNIIKQFRNRRLRGAVIILPEELGVSTSPKSIKIGG